MTPYKYKRTNNEFMLEVLSSSKHENSKKIMIATLRIKMPENCLVFEVCFYIRFPQWLVNSPNIEALQALGYL